MKIESTAAKIGRSMKKREIMRFFALRRGRCGAVASVLAVVGLALPAGLRRVLRHRARVDDLHRRARADLHDAVDDDALARLQARLDDPAVAGPFADLHRAAARPCFRRSRRRRTCPSGLRAPRAAARRSPPGAPRPASTMRTNSPARSTCSRFANSARASLVPVCVLTRTSVKSSVPRVRVSRAVGELDRRLEAVARGQLEAPCLDVAPDREDTRGRGCRRSRTSDRSA